MDLSSIILVSLSTVGVTEVIKNFIQKGGKRIWTLATIVVGILMTLISVYFNEKVLLGIVSVSGATLFYDTVYKSFHKVFEKLSVESEENDR